jgi:ubiquinone/menaquinone biosynthesis C-methylase UbiE
MIRMSRFRRWAVALAVLAAVVVLGWLGRDWLRAQVYLFVLEHDERVESLQVDRVIDALGLAPGQRVADIGAGTGLFTRPIAAALGPAGTVYAVDVNRTLLDHIEETARSRGLANIRTVLSAENDPLLPGRVDLAFICDTLHHIENRAGYLLTLRRYLEPGGRVAVIDFRENESPHLSSSMKLNRTEVNAWMKSAGYSMESDHDFVGDNFFMIYRCETCPAER